MICLGMMKKLHVCCVRYLRGGACIDMGCIGLEMATMGWIIVRSSGFPDASFRKHDALAQSHSPKGVGILVDIHITGSFDMFPDPNEAPFHSYARRSKAISVRPNSCQGPR